MFSLLYITWATVAYIITAYSITVQYQQVNRNTKKTHNCIILLGGKCIIKADFNYSHSTILRLGQVGPFVLSLGQVVTRDLDVTLIQFILIIVLM